MVLTTIVCMLALLEFMVLGMLVGQARGRFEVQAPATSGHEIFDRYFRVHYNTLEQLAVFIPALFAFGWFVSDLWAAVVGLVFVVGRALYARQYIADPASRGPGMLLTFGANVVLVLGTLIALVLMLF